MNYNEFYEKMKSCGLISKEWGNLIRLLFSEIADCPDPDTVMKLFILYFSLIDDGNTYMLLKSDVMKEKFSAKIKQQRAKTEEEEEESEIRNTLDRIASEIEQVSDAMDPAALGALSVIGENKLFVIDEEDRLFAGKYYHAVSSIRESADRLLNGSFPAAAVPFGMDTVTRLKLKDRQKEVIEKGLSRNILITGGPGTGKTTSIFFLLLGLLSGDEKYHIYLTAPSGKAAARMSESIKEEKDSILEPYKTDKKEIIEKIASVEGQTVHRLLGSRGTEGFFYNKENPFDKRSVFVIDEASMIDVCLFASLLEAIPTGARVFILGDKNQLPSVECGAVYGDLLRSFKDNVVELNETNRFSTDSEIYKLSEKINSGSDLELDNGDFLAIEDLKITKDNSKEILFYADDKSNKEIAGKITDEWFRFYFSGFQDQCTDIKNDPKTFDHITDLAEKSKILCALRETARGADHINKIILEKNYKGKKISGFYPGEILVITKNLGSLALYNGDCGVTVKFDGDETLYFMIRKSEGLQFDKDEKKENQIFKLGEFFFYPVRMIGREDISSAFAITVHKSQGSGYDDVFVILPKNNGHPLLNRQLVYTAITRAKKRACIISNPENLEYASKNALSRDTGI